MKFAFLAIFLAGALFAGLGSAQAANSCRAGSLSCLQERIGSSCSGTGVCIATKKLPGGDYACSCRPGRGNDSGVCRAGNLSCLGRPLGARCGLGSCLPIGNTIGGDFNCECR